MANGLLLKQPITDEQWRHRMALVGAIIKQTLTLDTASIIAVTALAGGFFDDPKTPWLLGLAVITFIASIFACYLALLLSIVNTDESYEDDLKDNKFLAYLFVIGISCFPVGLIFLAIFVWINTVG